jgi:hypothetical protein
MAQINIMKLIREGREALEKWGRYVERDDLTDYAGAQASATRATAVGTAESIVMYYEIDGGIEVLRELRDAMNDEDVDAARAAWERLVELVASRGKGS